MNYSKIHALSPPTLYKQIDYLNSDQYSQE